MNEQPAVYIMASKRNGALYVGVASDLVKRIWEHRNGLVEGFSNRYSAHHLVWYELHGTMESAIQREKRLKEWKRSWKIHLIEKNDPRCEDLRSKMKIIGLDSGLKTAGMTSGCMGENDEMG